MNKPWKAVTIYDIALKIGKSPSTVSRALNDHPMVKLQTRNLIKKTAKQLGFEFDSQTSPVIRRGSRTLGVIVPFLHQDGMAEMVAGILDAGDTAGYGIIVSQSADSSKKEAEQLRSMFTKRVDGLLICLASEEKEPGQFAKYQQFNIPICSFYKTLHNSYGGKVRINDQTAAYQLTTHLIAEGCLRIGYVTSPSNNQLFKDRINGYMAALKEHGIAFSEDLIFRAPMTITGGEAIAKQIAGSGYIVDGLVFSDDRCAIGCMNMLRNYGKLVPHDVAIASFNTTGDTLLEYPGLTTIEYPHYHIGQLAASQLINEIHSKQTQLRQPFSIDVGHELVIRDSSKKRQPLHTLKTS